MKKSDLTREQIRAFAQRQTAASFRLSGLPVMREPTPVKDDVMPLRFGAPAIPCPHCASALDRWYGQVSGDADDSEPHAECTNPDCGYWY